MRISFAQNREDILLWRCFGRQRSGFFLDVGAGSPIRDKVTNLFYEHGWSGLNFDTIAISESSAGGLISPALPTVPGASAYFLGGMSPRGRICLQYGRGQEMTGCGRRKQRVATPDRPHARSLTLS